MNKDIDITNFIKLKINDLKKKIYDLESIIKEDNTDEKKSISEVYINEKTRKEKEREKDIKLFEFYKNYSSSNDLNTYINFQKLLNILSNINENINNINKTLLSKNIVFYDENQKEEINQEEEEINQKEEEERNQKEEEERNQKEEEEKKRKEEEERKLKEEKERRLKQKEEEERRLKQKEEEERRQKKEEERRQKEEEDIKKEIKLIEFKLRTDDNRDLINLKRKIDEINEKINEENKIIKNNTIDVKLREKSNDLKKQQMEIMRKLIEQFKKKSMKLIKI